MLVPVSTQLLVVLSLHLGVFSADCLLGGVVSAGSGLSSDAGSGLSSDAGSELSSGLSSNHSSEAGGRTRTAFLPPISPPAQHKKQRLFRLVEYKGKYVPDRINGGNEPEFFIEGESAMCDLPAYGGDYPTGLKLESDQFSLPSEIVAALWRFDGEPVTGVRFWRPRRSWHPIVTGATIIMAFEEIVAALRPILEEHEIIAPGQAFYLLGFRKGPGGDDKTLYRFPFSGDEETDERRWNPAKGLFVQEIEGKWSRPLGPHKHGSPASMG